MCLCFSCICHTVSHEHYEAVRYYTCVRGQNPERESYELGHLLCRCIMEKPCHFEIENIGPRWTCERMSVDVQAWEFDSTWYHVKFHEGIRSWLDATSLNMKVLERITHQVIYLLKNSSAALSPSSEYDLPLERSDGPMWNIQSLLDKIQINGLSADHSLLQISSSAKTSSSLHFYVCVKNHFTE